MFLWSRTVNSLKIFKFICSRTSDYFKLCLPDVQKREDYCASGWHWERPKGNNPEKVKWCLNRLTGRLSWSREEKGCHFYFWLFSDTQERHNTKSGSWQKSCLHSNSKVNEASSGFCQQNGIELRSYESWRKGVLSHYY